MNYGPPSEDELAKEMLYRMPKEPADGYWVCAACGKKAKDKFAEKGEVAPGWDESCMLNSVWCRPADGSEIEAGIAWYAIDPQPEYYVAKSTLLENK